MVEFIFIDLDDTILDFHQSERRAIGKTLTAFGIEPTDEVCALYSRINKAQWERLERKELTREQVMLGRFATLFSELGIVGDPKLCSDTYASNLAIGHYFLPGAEAALERLSKKYQLFLASNGNAAVQDSRLKSANISRFFQDIFISQHLDADKPSVQFFERAFARIPNFDRNRAMIVGDSLTSDILGGNNAGIATCWVNPRHLPRREDIRVDHEIESLSQLEGLLETL